MSDRESIAATSSSATTTCSVEGHPSDLSVSSQARSPPPPLPHNTVVAVEAASKTNGNGTGSDGLTSTRRLPSCSQGVPNESPSHQPAQMMPPEPPTYCNRSNNVFSSPCMMTEELLLGYSYGTLNDNEGSNNSDD